MAELTDHQLQAAVVVAQLIDVTGNAVDDAHESFRLAVTHGLHPSEELRAAEQILVRAGLLTVDRGRICVSQGLAQLCALNDPEAAAHLLRDLIGARELQDLRSEAGAAGEEHVVTSLREQLSTLGRADLAQQVARVSLISDSFGYDIQAPTVSGPPRLLEVKTESTPGRDPLFTLFISRHEFEIGQRNAGTWSLVACRRHPALGVVEVVGWCRSAVLDPYLPDDRHGRWMEARVALPAHLLIPGLPPPV